MQARIRDEYFEWLFDLICDRGHSEVISYRKLLLRLHDTEFTYLIRKDQNRAEDGVCLRRRFILTQGYEDSYDYIMRDLDCPCSVLEMMIALAIRCEETIMDDTRFGNRASQWFWGMIKNLGLMSMSDDRFSKRLVDNIIARFLDRDYEPDGQGGLFTIRDCCVDLRDVEIWYQLLWYLDSIT